MRFSDCTFWGKRGEEEKGGKGRRVKMGTLSSGLPHIQTYVFFSGFSSSIGKERKKHSTTKTNKKKEKCKKNNPRRKTISYFSDVSYKVGLARAFYNGGFEQNEQR